ncbi:hypothetical protein CTAYLR_002514 [Chrysophaeum taylorii]|uniref:ATP synthase subunit b n=1 Tax=Chrysophaeum taylorii TaxID=2483200 RepID=A0AAD7UH77_9STRA|nr:hypothetical protein CTAYLR_002514 [Chrysophaeum taylorii]
MLAARTLARQAPRLSRQISINSYLAKVGLDDWKRQLPLGIVLAIPLIQNEVLILSEETQLVGCFCLFCGTAYQLGADSVSDMLAAKSKSITEQHNAVEDQAIAGVREMVEAHEKRVEMLTVLKTVGEAQAQAMADLKVAKAMEFKHTTRDSIVKMLDTLVAKEDQARAAMTAKIIAEAAANVTSKFADPDVKSQALTESISILQTGGSPQLVSSMFKDYFKSRAENAAAMKGTDVPLPPEAQAEIADELKALAKRDGREPTFSIPASVTI